MPDSFPNYKQRNGYDCGPVCLRIIAKYYGENWSVKSIKDLCKIGKRNSSLEEISLASEIMGFSSFAARIPLNKLQTIQVPFIVYLNKSHFVVVYSVKKNKVLVSDPEKGLITWSYKKFLQVWENEKGTGVILTLEPKETCTNDK